MDVLKFFTVRLCPWDMRLTGRRKKKKNTLDKHSELLAQFDEFILIGPRQVRLIK